MKYVFSAITLFLFSYQSNAQLDSLSLELFINVPAGSSNFDLTRQVGIKLGKRNSSVRYSIGYGNFNQNNAWYQFYDDANSRWTTNALTLYEYSDSTPANSRRGQVNTTSHALTIGWSNELKSTYATLYGGVSLSAFLNKVDILQKESDAYLASGINDPNYEFEQGQAVNDVSVRYKNDVITSDTRFNSVVPALNLEAGAVFTMGSKFKLIPKINIGAYLDDSRIRIGNLAPLSRRIDANVRMAMQLSYIIL